MNKLMVRMNKKNKKGFTLVELIVVMAILAILAAILIPSVSGMIRRSNQAVDNATGRNFYMAGAMVAAQSETVTISVTGWPATYNDGTPGQKIVMDFIGNDAPALKQATNITLTVTGGNVRVYKDADNAGNNYSPLTGKFTW